MKRPNTSEARGRAFAYGAIAAILLAGAAFIPSAAWRAGPAVHAQLATVALFLDAAIGVLALVRHYSRRERHFLFVGLTFLGAALLDLYHASVAVRIDAGLLPPDAVLRDWTWFAARVFLAVFLLRLALAARGSKEYRDLRVSEAVLYGMFCLVVAVALFVISSFELPPTHGGGRLGQPHELLPGLLFLLALVTNLWRGAWRTNAFEHWLIISLLLAVGAQFLGAAPSREPYDAGFVVAHGLRIGSYVAVFVGLLASVYFTYRDLEQSRHALAGANVALQHEVREREATERELQIRTAYLEQLFENAPEAVVVLDGDDRIVRVNVEFTRMFGYGTTDAVGRRINDLIVPPHLVDEASDMTRVVAAGDTISAETVRCRKDGSTLEVSVLGTPIVTAQGQVAVYGIYRDITEQRRAERARRESADRLEAIVHSSPLAIMAIGADTVIRNWNPAAERLFGWTATEMLGQPFSEWTVTRRDAAADLVRRSLAGEVVQGHELEQERKDGSIAYISVSTAPLPGEDGRPAGVLAVIADVTDRKRAVEAMRLAKAEAESANRAKSEFLASMSHELRTPLNSVIGFTRILLRNRQGNLLPMDLTYLERIAANGEHLLGLINSVLDLSKIEAGMIELEWMDADLGTLVGETVSQLEGRVPDGVVLRAELPAGLAPLRTDPHRLRQVLINLIGNALKFTERGEVVVSVVAEEGAARCIRVRDTGVGIPADRLPLIFEKFQQADQSTSRRYGGTGLGLSISRGICAELGYDLSVESEVGVGSTFTIALATRPVVEAK